MLELYSLLCVASVSCPVINLLLYKLEFAFFFVNILNKPFENKSACR